MDSYTFSYEFNEKRGLLTMNHAKQSDIDSFEYPSNMTEFFCTSDYIDRLVIPHGTEAVNVIGIGLKELILPDTVEFVYCHNNFLKELDLPSSIIVLDAHDNYLEKITFRGVPSNLMTFMVSNNRLSELNFDVSSIHNVPLIDARRNPLKFISEDIIRMIDSHEESKLDQ